LYPKQVSTGKSCRRKIYNRKIKMILFPKIFLKLLISGSLGLTLIGTVVLIVLVIRDLRGREVW
jgi:hypothetical protein